MRAALLATAMLCLLAGGVAGAGDRTASCYGRENHQFRTATGENYNPSRLTAAYWFAPLGALIRVLNLDNGRTVDVRINDRGPARRLVARGRVIDLSLGACRALGFFGLARVALQIVNRATWVGGRQVAQEKLEQKTDGASVRNSIRHRRVRGARRHP